MAYEARAHGPETTNADRAGRRRKSQHRQDLRPSSAGSRCGRLASRTT